MLLSVIIPFYNVEPYFDACLQRVSLLPEQDCEVLLIDDCGQDGSAAIASAYVSTHKNFRVIRRAKNGGLSAARNTGLAQAKGEFVYFLDSDDLPLPDALMRMVHRAKEAQLDIIKGRFFYFDDITGDKKPGPAIADHGLEPGNALLARQCKDGTYEPMVWQCLYRRNFLAANDLIMTEGILFEDELFQAPALLAARRTQVLEEPILMYRQRQGSIMNSFAKSARWCESYLFVCRALSNLTHARSDSAAHALRRRAGQIALSVAKNIPAYHLPATIAEEAFSFVCSHKSELAGFALRSGDILVAAQGLLLFLSPHAFLRLYRHV